MKFLLSLSFLLFAAASSINASSFFAEGHPRPILDLHGAPLQFGVPYYLRPALWFWTRGLRLRHANPFQACQRVIHLTDEPYWGTPVVFSSAVQSVTGNITDESELIINFYNLTSPNDEVCGGSNSTTWMTTRMWDVAVGGEEMSTVFRLYQGGMNDFYMLIPVLPCHELDFMVGLGYGNNLEVQGYKEWRVAQLWFAFIPPPLLDEDDKPVIIQMPRKMSV